MYARSSEICEIGNQRRELYETEDNQEIEYLKPMYRYFNNNGYKIVSNKCYKIVQSEVSDLINSGWELYKSIVVTCFNDCVIYTQVLIKTVMVH